MVTEDFKMLKWHWSSDSEQQAKPAAFSKGEQPHSFLYMLNPITNIVIEWILNSAKHEAKQLEHCILHVTETE